MEIATKVCSMCGDTKPLEKFYKKSGAASGVQSSCRECTRDKTSKLRAAQSPEKLLALAAAYRERNPEKVRAWNAAYRAENRNTLRARNAAYRAENLEKFIEKSRANVANLTDSYVAHTLSLKVPQVPPDLLELKREQLRHKRALKELKEFLTESEKAK